MDDGAPRPPATGRSPTQQLPPPEAALEAEGCNGDRGGTEADEPGGVVVEHLVKRYRKNPVPAVDGVSFRVGRGEIFGLLGPNGAGKTTTIGILTTRVRPDGGRATLSDFRLGHPSLEDVFLHLTGRLLR